MTSYKHEMEQIGFKIIEILDASYPEPIDEKPKYVFLLDVLTSLIAYIVGEEGLTNSKLDLIQVRNLINTLIDYNLQTVIAIYETINMVNKNKSH